jgi:DNA repair protein REV1
MGHGRCETFSKQSPLSGLNGRATGDPRTIGSCALKLLRSFRFDCKELRGLAIQIQKLESVTGIAAPQSGQARLTFKQAEQPLKAGTSTSSSTRPPFLPPPPPPPPPPIPAPAIFDDQIKNGLPAESNPPRAAAPPFDLPSFSQVDPSVLDALPEDIRQELNAEYHRRSRSRSITPAPRQVTFKEPAPIPGPSKRIQVKGVSAVQRTIHQLSPKKSTVQSPTKSWSHKGTGFSALDLTDDELIKLDIDVEFFRALPRDIQRDQIAYVRHLKSGKPLPSTAPRKVLKVPKFKRPAVRAFAPPPRPKANLPPPASIKQAVYNKDGTRRKVFLHAKEDIEDAIETWVNSFRTTPPNSSDVEFFAKFLLKSVTVNKREGTDGGVETAVRVMHWWQLLLRQGWKASEHVLVAEEGGDSVGIAWWKAFHDVKTRLNDQTRNRFGGSIVFS